MTEDPFGLFPAKQVIDDGAAVESSDERDDREEREEFEQKQKEETEGLGIAPGMGGGGMGGGGLWGLWDWDVGRVNRLQPAQFRPMEGELGKEFELPGEVAFAGYWATHQEDLADNGRKADE